MVRPGTRSRRASRRPAATGQLRFLPSTSLAGPSPVASSEIAGAAAYDAARGTAARTRLPVGAKARGPAAGTGRSHRASSCSIRLRPRRGGARMRATARDRPWRRRFASWAPLLLGLLLVEAYFVFVASAGTFTAWPTYTRYHDFQ